MKTPGRPGRGPRRGPGTARKKMFQKKTNKAGKNKMPFPPRLPTREFWERGREMATQAGEGAGEGAGDGHAKHKLGTKMNKTREK